jgi:excisionase family DNA binding protein
MSAVEYERPDKDALLLTPEQAARRLSIGRTKIYELVSKGVLRSVRIDRSRRIPATALADYVRALEDGTSTDGG